MGALIGAVMAGALSAYGAYANASATEQANKDAIAYAKEQAALINKQYADLQSDIAEYHEGRRQELAAAGVGSEALKDYVDAVNGGIAGDGRSDVEYIEGFYGGLTPFEYSKTTDQFMDPRYEELADVAARRVQATAAGAGMGRSYDAAKKMGQAVADVNEGLYRDALTAQQADRSQAYQEWNSYLQTKQNELNAILSGRSNDLSTMKSVADLYTGEQQNEFEDLMNARLAAINAQSQGAAAVGNAGNLQPQVDIGSIISAVGAGANVGQKAQAAWNA